MMKTLLTTTTFLLLLTACGQKTSKVEFDDGTSGLGLSQDQVTFSVIKSQILAPKCLSCHAGMGTEQGLSAYVVAGNPDSSSLYIRTKNGTMPQNGTPLSTRELGLIHDYITNLGNTGAGTTTGTTTGDTTTPPTTTPPDTTPPTTTTGGSSGGGTTTPPTTTPPSTGITYAQVKTRILTQYGCTGCHSGSGSEAGLAKWINRTTPTQSSFYTMTKSGQMPQGRGDVTVEDQEYILQYIKDYIARTK